jgi:hypothetical protein
MIVLVCGGRNYGKTDNEIDWFFYYMNNLHSDVTITKVVSGAAPGADSLAVGWAIANHLEYAEYPAQWSKYGKKAGPLRNKQMLASEEIDLVIAFPGGNGTDDMVSQARYKGVEIRRVEKKFKKSEKST